METTERKPAGSGRIVGLVVLLPFLYLASIGPLYWVVARTGPAEAAVGMLDLYSAPVSALCDVSPRSSQLMRRYLDWFVPRPAVTPPPPWASPTPTAPPSAP